MIARTLAVIATALCATNLYAQDIQEELPPTVEEVLYEWIVPENAPHYTQVVELAGITYYIRSNSVTCTIWPVLEKFWCGNTFGDLKRDEEALRIYNFIDKEPRREYYDGELLLRKHGNYTCTKIVEPDMPVRTNCRLRNPL